MIARQTSQMAYNAALSKYSSTMEEFLTKKNRSYVQIDELNKAHEITVSTSLETYSKKNRFGKQRKEISEPFIDKLKKVSHENTFLNLKTINFLNRK